MRPPFHYTDAAGLIGILSSRSLYATDYRYLNDASEFASIRSLLVPIFQRDVNKIMPALTKQGIIKEDYYTEMGTHVEQLEAEGLYRALVKAVDNISPFFVVSFCRHDVGGEEYEYGLLSQWRGYAAGGGFAVEFDEDGLDALAKEEKEQFAYLGFKSANVNYRTHEQEFHAADYEGAAGEMIRGALQREGLDVSAVTGRKNINDIVLAYANTAPFLKHPTFAEEDEYRIVFVCYRASKLGKGDKLPAKRIKVRPKEGLLVPYIELFEKSSARLPMKCIIVGPHPSQARQEEALKMLLETEGLNVPVRCSQIPYRT